MSEEQIRRDAEKLIDIYDSEEMQSFLRGPTLWDTIKSFLLEVVVPSVVWVMILGALGLIYMALSSV